MASLVLASHVKLLGIQAKESNFVEQEEKTLTQKLSEHQQNKTEYFIPVNLIVKIMSISEKRLLSKKQTSKIPKTEKKINCEILLDNYYITFQSFTANMGS